MTRHNTETETEENVETENWYEDYENIKWFAKVLQQAGVFDDANELQYYYEKPWKWAAEWKAWVEIKQPEPTDDNWNDFIEALNELQ